MKEKYSGKGLFSPEAAKQKAEILSVELNSLFDIRFEKFNVEDHVDLNDIEIIF
uniref:Uncharacterized protein n=1 Tax=Meloidogyne enterolobii TaxID=390850 RepID=A0A6V7URN7_MELEN|nr:unnamed protein product [Meloidogyne enterolobii]